MAPFALRVLRSRIVTPRRFIWLLWLALLLPVGQVAAAWHVLSHTGAETSSEGDGDKGLHPIHCDLCLTAAVIGGGGLPGESPSLPRLAASHELPQAAASGVWLAPPVRAYRSRAPPFVPL